MLGYVAERFAEVLTKGDVVELFRMLEQRYGTVSGVCERVGIERRTFYNWRSARWVTGETKAKVLRVALEEYPVDTLEFLARKSMERARELLELLIEYLRRGIAEEEDMGKVEELARRAESIVREFSVPVTEYLRNMIYSLIEATYSRGFRIEVMMYAGYPSIQQHVPIHKTLERQERFTFKILVVATSTAGTVPVLTTEVPQSLPEVRVY